MASASSVSQARCDCQALPRPTANGSFCACAQAGRRRVDNVRVLLAGADANAQGPAGWAPLHLAAARGHAEVLELLLASGSFRRRAAAEAEGERLRALEGWGLLPDVLERVAACSCLLGYLVIFRSFFRREWVC